MILLGCLLAFSAAVAPRVVLVLAWIFSDRWHAVWQGEWIWPLLGIIFLPYTTIMYLLVWSPVGGIAGWDWLWIILGLFLDFMKWSQMIANRKEATTQTMKYYPAGAPGSSVDEVAVVEDAAVTGGQVPPSTSPTSSDTGTTTAPPSDAPKDEGGSS